MQETGKINDRDWQEKIMGRQTRKDDSGDSLAKMIV
jgi:hypothetical protein